MGDEGGDNPFAGALKKKKKSTAPPADDAKPAAEEKPAGDNPFGGALKKKKKFPPDAGDEGPAQESPVAGDAGKKPTAASLRASLRPDGDEASQKSEKISRAGSKMGKSAVGDPASPVDAGSAEGGDLPPTVPKGSRRNSVAGTRVGSSANLNQTATPTVDPRSPAGGPPPGDSGFARSGSRASLTESQRAAAAERQGSQLAGSQVASGSRRGSMMQGSRQGSQLGGSRRGSQMGNSQMGAATAPAATVADGQEAAADAEEDLGSVDWKMNWKTVSDELATCKDQLAAKEAECKGLKEEVDSLKAEIEAHEAAGDKGGKEGKPGKDSAKELTAFKKKAKEKEEKLEKEIQELEAQLRRRGSQTKQLTQEVNTLERKASHLTAVHAEAEQGKAEVRSLERQNTQLDETIQELQRKNQRLQRQLDEKDAELRNSGGVRTEVRTEVPPEVLAELQQLRAHTQSRDQEIHERAAEIQQLRSKLDQAQDAIVSATDYGWENDIKLAQARRALMSILDHHSPERAGRKSGASPGGHAGPSEEQLRLDALREQLAELTERKTKAVEEEDYATAQQLLAEGKAVREQIEQLQQAVAAPAALPDPAAAALARGLVSPARKPYALPPGAAYHPRGAG